jgi:hypothetical protein
VVRFVRDGLAALTVSPTHGQIAFLLWHVICSRAKGDTSRKSRFNPTIGEVNPSSFGTPFRVIQL